MADLVPNEIKALARILDELDYYQLLQVQRGAGAAKVKAAYYQNARLFHPDANRHHDPELRAAVECIAKTIAEAYSVLRDPRRRQAYDRRLDAGNGIRMQLVEAQAAAGRIDKEERQGRTRQGRQFYNLAAQDLERSDFAAAARNLQTALTFEPGNAYFKQLLEDARTKSR